ncbi:hypothetical protein [Roseovarius sp. 217 phage 1]|uniref:Uncharacterized protein n=1 Tax=Roseovarius sp. 217 phage 1 TaxID=874471 RepID=E3PZA4_9CAUD|nr:hypothetical protein [Roseovarius sp. 217 phage 1]
MAAKEILGHPVGTYQIPALKRFDVRGTKTASQSRSKALSQCHPVWGVEKAGVAPLPPPSI